MFEKEYLIDLINRYPTIDLGSESNSEYKHLTVIPKSEDLLRLQKGELHVLTDFFVKEKLENEPTEIGLEIDGIPANNIALPFGYNLDDHIQCIWYILYQPLFRAVNKGNKFYHFLSLETKFNLLDLIEFFFEEQEKELQKKFDEFEFDEDEYEYF